MNIKFFSKFTLIFSFFLLMPEYAQAQKSGKSLEFSCVIWNNLSYPQIFYRQGEKFIPLKLSPSNRSKLYPLKGTSVLELYIPDETEEKTAYKLVGKKSIAEGMKRMLFFITERSIEGKLPLGVSGVDDSLLAFPRGACRFMNLTGVPLAVTFAGRTSKIKPKEMTVVKSRVSSEGGLLPFIIKNRAGKNLYENRFFAQDIGRDMIFILPPKRKGGRAVIRLLPQLVAFPPKKTITK